MSRPDHAAAMKIVQIILESKAVQGTESPWPQFVMLARAYLALSRRVEALESALKPVAPFVKSQAETEADQNAKWPQARQQTKWQDRHAAISAALYGGKPE